MVGPGTVPLMVQASTRWPLTTSHITCLAVKVKCLAPSGSSVYVAGCPPYSCVALGTLPGADCDAEVVIEEDEDEVFAPLDCALFVLPGLTLAPMPKLTRATM